MSINGSYILSNIGELTMNSDGNYVFEPCMSGVLTPAFYGLSSFEATPSIITKELNKETISIINDDVFEDVNDTNDDVLDNNDNILVDYDDGKIVVKINIFIKRLNTQDLL